MNDGARRRGVRGHGAGLVITKSSEEPQMTDTEYSENLFDAMPR